MSHVTCTTGQVLPVWEIGRLAQEYRYDQMRALADEVERIAGE